MWSRSTRTHHRRRKPRAQAGSGATRVDPGHRRGPGRHAWIQVIDGILKLNGLSLTSGDGAAVSDEGQLRLDALAPSHFVLFDLA